MKGAGMTSDSVTISSALLSAEVSARGAEMQSLRTNDGRDLLWDGDPAFWTGRAPILFPVVGLLNGGQYHYDGCTYTMPKHGFARGSEFAVTKQSDAAVTMRLAASDATRGAYPFDFTLDLTFRLDGAILQISAAIANHGGMPMPASFGFHPALRWPLPFGAERTEHRIAFDNDEPEAVRRIGPDGLLLPQSEPSPVTGRELALRDDLFSEDALIFNAIRSRSVNYGAPHGPQLRVTFGDFPVLGVWTKPGASFICIEPWQGLPDPAAFAGDIRDKPGIMLIAPGDIRRLAMTVAVTGSAE